MMLAPRYTPLPPEGRVETAAGAAWRPERTASRLNPKAARLGRQLRRWAAWEVGAGIDSDLRDSGGSHPAGGGGGGSPPMSFKSVLIAADVAADIPAPAADGDLEGSGGVHFRLDNGAEHWRWEGIAAAGGDRDGGACGDFAHLFEPAAAAAGGGDAAVGRDERLRECFSAPGPGSGFSESAAGAAAPGPIGDARTDSDREASSGSALDWDLHSREVAYWRELFEAAGSGGDF